MGANRISPIPPATEPVHNDLNTHEDMATAIKALDNDNQDRYTNLLSEAEDDLNHRVDLVKMHH